MYEIILQYLGDIPFNSEISSFLSLCSFFFLGSTAYLIIKHVFAPLAFSVLSKLISGLKAVPSKYKTTLIRHVSHLGFILVWLNLEVVFIGHLPELLPASFTLSHIFFYIVVSMIGADVLSVGGSLYEQLQFSREVPIRGVIQVLKLILFIVTLILIVSVLVGESPLYLLSGLGALTAVLLLVFKDTILGFVASIQIAANRLVSIGDWIEVEKFGADGEVLDLGLNTVKVQNWDNTITTIPTYALISDSFKNWRGMQESQGRRIKRAIVIDTQSVNELSQTEKEAVSSEVGGYQFTEKTCINISLFREYIEHKLAEHPQINQELTCMMRQLAPTRHGMPLEIYCFCKDKNWVSYEHIQAALIEEIVRDLSYFKLKLYQSPSSCDLKGLQQIVE